MPRVPGIRRAEVEPNALFRRLYRPLGAIAVTFADLESQLTAVLNSLMKIPYKEGAALEWFMQNVSLRIELFHFLAQTNIKETSLRKSAEKIYGALQQANADRNNLLHGAWSGWDPTTDTFSKIRLKAEGGKLTEIPVYGVALELLKEEVDYIVSTNMRLADLMYRVKRQDTPTLWPPPLPGKFLRPSPLANLFREHKAKARERQPQSSRA